MRELVEIKKEIKETEIEIGKFICDLVATVPELRSDLDTVKALQKELENI
ncbi:hypothetical protein [Veillonella sp.]|nr:hypothetical protein [Veillonella sp.]DAW59801.1 MAG TPA: hypothetical protein [Caudoviricetes sp.]